MEFNPQVLLLFANAFLTTALSVLIVGTILVREYLPTIRKLKQSAADSDATASATAPGEPVASRSHS